MIIELEKAKQLLHSGEYTCVLYKDKQIYTSTKRGVKPLVDWLQSGTEFEGYYAADKVIGKATAFLYVLLKVKAVYAHVISKAALQVLYMYNIDIEYGEIVENIINRSGNGICPFESAVLNVDDVNFAYDVIQKKIADFH